MIGREEKQRHLLTACADNRREMRTHNHRSKLSILLLSARGSCSGGAAVQVLCKVVPHPLALHRAASTVPGGQEAVAR